MEQYRKDYEAYMNSLTDEQREYEEIVTQSVVSKKKKSKREAPPKEESIQKLEKPLFPGEPQKPPG